MKLDKLVGKLKINISNAYSVAAATLDDLKSAAKNDEIYMKASQLDRLHQAMTENLVTAHDGSEYLVWTVRELMKVILAKPSPETGKKIHKKQLTLLLTFNRQMPVKKDCVSIGKKIQKQKLQVLCNLCEMCAVFKEKNLKKKNVKLEFCEFCTDFFHKLFLLLFSEITWVIYITYI